MSPVYPTLPRLAVRDSFDDEDLSDVDDEVFIRDGRNGGLKIDDEGGVKRPLMAPRRKCKMNRLADKRRLTCRALIAPCCYGSIALLVLMGLIILVIFAVSVFPVPLTFFKNWLTQSIQDNSKELEIAACTSLAASTVWTRSLPKLTSEAPLRSIDVNGDNIEDVIIAFSTVDRSESDICGDMDMYRHVYKPLSGLNDVDTPQYICNVYFGGQMPCLGGVLALDGTTGETIWTHWTWHVIFSLNCNLDLNGDQIKDCIAAGRGGTMRAISGRDGSELWTLPLAGPDKPDHHRILDVFDANYISDIDNDEVGDIIAAHTIQIAGKRTSDILIVSGKSGSIIHRIAMTNKEQLYLAPQMLVHPDGEKILVLVTGSHEQSGGLYVASLSDLLYGKLYLQELYHDSVKGILSQPILADITEDGTEDILAAMFDSVIVAYNGRTFEQIWNYTVPNSEIISSPVPGYYNDDDIPDFMVKHQLGPGFPIYYYTVATILDGKSGKPLLENELQDGMSGQMSGLSVTVDGYGNDWFLHWSADCLNHEGDRSAYQFLKTTSLPSQMGADLCKLRFNSTLSTKLLALSQHTAPPGLPLYVSDEWKKLEYNGSIDARKEAEKYSETHSDYDSLNPEVGVSSITERSLRIQPNRRGRPGKSQPHRSDIFSEQTNYYPDSKGTDNAKELKDDIAGNGPDTNVSDDFGSDEDWRDSNKWDDENKDYNLLYDEGNNHGTDLEKENGIREQRSGSIDMKKVNNETNDPRNQLDPSMDYTNGQTDNNNYRSLLVNNRTTNIEDSLGYPEISDFDFDNVEGHSRDPVTEKRSVAGYRNKSEAEGQQEVAVDSPQNNRNELLFLKVQKRPTAHQTPPKVELNELFVSGSTHNLVELHGLSEKVTPHKKYVPNISTELRNTSGHSDLTANVNTAEKDKTIVDKITTEDTWPTRDVFAKVTQNNEEDANIEKVFKRESMKNRKSLRGNKSNIQKDVKNEPSTIRNTKSKREVTTNSEMEHIYGVQRQPPTGILLPSLIKTSNSIDLVFSTSWLPPSDASVILLQQDLDCIHRKREDFRSSTSHGNENQQQRSQVVLECLAERGVDYKVLEEGTDRENVKVPLGQMTVYRTKLECVCPEDMLKGQICRNISPQQSWPAHLGPLTNGYFRPLRKPAS